MLEELPTRGASENGVGLVFLGASLERPMPKNDLDGAGDTDLVCLSLGARASFDILGL